MSNGKNNAANPRYYHNYTVEFQSHFSGTDPDSKHCSEYANECVRLAIASIIVFRCLFLVFS